MQLESNTLLCPRHRVVPGRDFRLLLEGVRGWVDSIAKDGGGCIGLVEGDEGFGQSLQAAAIADACRRLGLRVLGGSAEESRPRPGGPFGYAIEQLAEEWRDDPDAPVGKVLSRYASDLVSLVSEGELASDAQMPKLSEDATARRIQDSVARCLFESSRRCPTVLILEDIDRGDELCRDFFAQLIRILGRARVRRIRHRLLVLVFNSSTGRQSAGAEIVEEQLSSIDSRTLTFRLRLRGYSRDDLCDYASKASIDVSLAQRESLLKESAGCVRSVRHLFGCEAPVGPPIFDAKLAKARGLVEQRFAALDENLREVVSLLAWSDIHLSGKMIVDAFSEDASVEPLTESASDDLAEDGTDAEVSAEVTEPESRIDEGVLVDLAARGWIRSVSLHTDASARRWAVEDGLQSWLRDWSEDLRLDSVARLKTVAAAAVGVERIVFREFLREECVEACVDSEQGVGMLVDAANGLRRLGLFERALDLVDVPAELKSRELDFLAVTLLNKAGHSADAFSRAMRLVDGEPEGSGERQLWRAVARSAVQLMSEESDVALTRAESILFDGEVTPERVEYQLDRAEIALEAGEVRSAESFSEAALDSLADFEASDALTGRTLCLAARSAHARGDYQFALECDRRLIDLSLDELDSETVVQTLLRAAACALEVGDLVTSHAMFEDGLELASKSGSRLLRGHALREFGAFWVNRERHEEAHRVFVQARAIFEDFEERAAVQDCEKRLFEEELRLGRYHTASCTLWRVVERQLDCNLVDILATDPSKRFAEQHFRSRQKALKRLEKRASKHWERMESGEMEDLVTELRDAGRLLDARAYAERALSSTVSMGLGRRGRLLRLRGEVQALLGRADDAFESYERSLQVFATAPDSSALGIAYLDIGALFLQRARLDRALEYFSRGLKLFLAANDAAGVGAACERLAEFLLVGGLPEPAGRVSLIAVGLARRGGDPLSELRACRWTLRAAIHSDDESVAREAWSRCALLDKILQSPVERCALRLEQGWAAFWVKDYAEAMSAAREGIEVARQSAVSSTLDELLHLVGAIEGAPPSPNHNFIRSLETLERAMSGAEERGSPMLRWQVLHTLASVYEQRGKVEVAGDFLKRAQAMRQVMTRGFSPGLARLPWASREIGELDLVDDLPIAEEVLVEEGLA